MTKFLIEGDRPLRGKVAVSGAKNAALKMIAASLLATGPCKLRNVPRISDVRVMIKLVEGFGVKSQWDDQHTLTLDPTRVHKADPDPRLVKKLRASLVLIGPALARFGQISLPIPGGDQIGRRPIDTHLNALRQLGAKIELKNDTYHLTTPKLKGATVFLDEMSVTATENTLMTALLVQGKTTIHVAASEPEIANLAQFLNNIGAKIRGAGSPTIEIEGVKQLSGGQATIIPDRIEASTLLLAGLITDGEVTISNLDSKYLANLLPTLERMNAKITIKNSQVTARRQGNLKPVNIDTRPYPGFSTDLQSPLAALSTQAQGTSRIFETLFENRFNYVDELNSMGAKIKILERHTVEIAGPTVLVAKDLNTRDIRAGAALVLAALAAKGQSVIENAQLIDRGHERLDEKLAKLGANITRIED